FTALKVDNTKPSSSITAPSNGAAVAGVSAIVTGTATDGTGAGINKVEVSTDNGVTWTNASGTTSWTFVWTLPADGTYTLKTRATDLVGLVETPGAGISVKVDNTKPTSVITSPSPGAAIGTSGFTITGTASDGTGAGVQSVEVSINGG